jgi:hypothetical protein
MPNITHSARHETLAEIPTESLHRLAALRLALAVAAAGERVVSSGLKGGPSAKRDFNELAADLRAVHDERSRLSR